MMVSQPGKLKFRVSKGLGLRVRILRFNGLGLKGSGFQEVQGASLGSLFGPLVLRAPGPVGQRQHSQIQ